MTKNIMLREDDHWVYPLEVLNIVCGATAVYVSLFIHRAPAVFLFCLLLWFTTNKIRRDYSPQRARIHVLFTMVASLLVALLLYDLTN